MNDGSELGKGPVHSGRNCMRVAPRRDLSGSRTKSLDSRALLPIGGRSSLLKIGAGLEALRLPSQSTHRAHPQIGYSGLGYASLCNSPVCSFLQEFGRESATRWFSVRVSPMSRFLKRLDRARTLAIEAMAASLTN